ncbi:TolC family protein [Tenacibaculum sp. SZ-18]|uniref:TolC family protein n=1 Tax=Tenacibaculum sp. SZ-18 TaxID=754423 RepID=UPI000C2D0226|nr:TolC family protein [Tenacibaculum sp. SZ-18]
MMRIFRTLIIGVCFFNVFFVNAQKKWSLEECVVYAKEHNIDVLKQKIRSEVLNSDVIIAKGNYLPDLSFTSSQNFSLGNSFNVSTGVGQRESSSNSFSLSSSLNVFNGFANKYKLQSARLTKDKSDSDIDKIRFDLALNITNKYLQVLFNKEIVKVAEEQLKISTENYNRLKELYSNALTGKRELLEIESTLASDKREKIIAENTVRNSLIELQELLDIQQIQDFDIEEIIVEDVSVFNVDVVDDLVENIPQIVSSKLDIDIKNKELKIVRTGFLPRLSLNYSYSSNYFHIIGEDDVVENQQTGELIPNGFWTQLDNNRTHFISISASFPIFNRFLNRENSKKAKEEIKIAKLDLLNNKQVLKNKIKLAKNDVIASKASLKSSEKALITQKEAFNILSQQYKNGNIGSYEFLEGKNKLIKNSSEFIKAKFEYYFKTKVLSYYYKQN